ncbi:MAG TPA: glycosyltransferase, partial [Blastocatellia bacterium]|nr:glycosyltransferase [Blastocatellia bacterium]
MHIVLVSDAETQGGAGIAASRLADSLWQAGHRVTRLVAATDEKHHIWQTQTLALSYPLPLLQRLAWHVLPPGEREAFGNRLLRGRLNELLAELRPDVINLHNLHQTFHPRWSPALVKTCLKHAPVVWTLHDMWSFTGRCVYSFGCERFVSGCDAACPTTMDYPALPPNRIAAAWAARREVLQDSAPLVAVTPSHWLAREAQRGPRSRHRRGPR